MIGWIDDFRGLEKYERGLDGGIGRCRRVVCSVVVRC